MSYQPQDAGPILFITRLPPDGDGPGGTQRSMQVLRALARHGPVDLLVLAREGDSEAGRPPSPEALALVRDYRALALPDWAPSWRRWPWLPWKAQQLWEFLRVGPVDAPRLSAAGLAALAAGMAARDYQVLLAERLSSAWIAEQLIARGLLRARLRLADFDDVLSRFKQRELDLGGAAEGRLRRWLARRTIARLAQAERTLGQTWDAAAAAAPDDLAALAAGLPGRPLHLLPNVVDRPQLDPTESRPGRVLFVGHLGYPPNVQGLRRFLAEAWPLIAAAAPEARLDVVGMYPEPDLAAAIAAAGGELHANAPSVIPYYRNASVIVSPIFYGSGTRIKIIEALAFGRPVVSTTLGAEGLAIEPGRQALIEDDLPRFAAAVVALLRDPGRAQALRAAGRRHYEAHFAPAALASAISGMIEQGARHHG